MLIYGTIKSDIARVESITKAIITSANFIQLLINPPTGIIGWINAIANATDTGWVSDVFNILNEVLYKGEDNDIAVSEPSSHAQAKLLAKAFEGTDKFKPYVAKW